jgi:hypothetical protein
LTTVLMMVTAAEPWIVTAAVELTRSDARASGEARHSNSAADGTAQTLADAFVIPGSNGASVPSSDRHRRLAVSCRPP